MGDENLRSLTHHIRSHRFMAHVRSSTGTQVSRSNCHPFIIDNWMFLHNGQIGEFEQVKYDLHQQLPEDLFLKRMGTTDSELIFLLMLKNGLREQPVDAIRQTLLDITQLMENRNIKEPLKASICISDGVKLWAARYSSVNEAPTVFIRKKGSNISLASEPLERNRDWKKITAQSILVIEGDTVTSHTI